MLALAIVPLAMTRVEPPLKPKSVRIRLGWLIRTSPVAALAAVAVGAANGAVWALGPVYALGRRPQRPEQVPWFPATAVVVGSAVGVYPAGRLSDRFDRRFIIVVLALAASLGAFFEAALWRHQGGRAARFALGFAVGVTSFSLYTIAISHANDRATGEQLLLVSSGMLFLYCVGAIVAPTIAASMMRLFGPPRSSSRRTRSIHLALALFTLWRIVRRAPAAAQRRATDEAGRRPEPGLP